MKTKNMKQSSVSLPVIIGLQLIITMVVFAIAGVGVMLNILPLAEQLTLALRTGLSPQIAVSQLMTGVVLRIVVGVGAAVVVQLLVLVFGMRFLLNRISQLELFGSSLAEGDLTAHNEIRSNDAVGRLARSMNIAVHNLNTMAVRILHALRASNRSADELSQKIDFTLASSSRIDSDAGEMREQFAALTEQISEASSSIEEILAAIASLSDQIGNQSAQVEETSAAVNEMGASIDSVARIAAERKNQAVQLVQTTRDGGEQVQETLTLMERVHEGIATITDALAVIDGIAGQTNLLAMNAAIEAAHAGEAGKGFAVVSDEIRRLAESTSENSRSISAGLKDTVAQMESALESSQRAETSFASVQDEVGKVSDAFNEISRSTDELSVGGSQMVRSIQELAAVTDAIREGSAEMKSGAQEATGSLQKIGDIAAQSTSRVEHIGSEVRTIVQSVNGIAAVNTKNQANMGRLNTEISSLQVDEQTVSAETDLDDVLASIEEF